MEGIKPEPIPLRISIPGCLNHLTRVNLQTPETISCLAETFSRKSRKHPEERSRSRGL
jgi:hypothetical protein